MTPNQQAFLDQYLALLTKGERDKIPQIIVEYFCADEYNANECARLINLGIKTATCSLKQGYFIDDEPLPQVGNLTVVLDWAENPICIVKVTDVECCLFNQVSEDFAQSEGEGDGTYTWWRKAHIDFFSEHAQGIDINFNEESELVLERFEKVYPL